LSVPRAAHGGRRPSCKSDAQLKSKFFGVGVPELDNTRATVNNGAAAISPTGDDDDESDDDSDDSQDWSSSSSMSDDDDDADCFDYDSGDELAPFLLAANVVRGVSEHTFDGDGNGHGNGHGRVVSSGYCVRVSTGTLEWEVWKRFSDFETLHAALRPRFPRFYASSSLHPSLPSRMSYSFTADARVAKRAAAFDAYLTQLLAVSELANSVEIFTFIGMTRRMTVMQHEDGGVGVVRRHGGGVVAGTDGGSAHARTVAAARNAYANGNGGGGVFVGECCNAVFPPLLILTV
jgi:hypothetical protein